jgi:hypothetical protein
VDAVEKRNIWSTGYPVRSLVTIHRTLENLCGTDACASILGKRNASFNKLIQFDPTATQRDNVGDPSNEMQKIHRISTVRVRNELSHERCCNGHVFSLAALF